MKLCDSNRQALLLYSLCQVAAGFFEWNISRHGAAFRKDDHQAYVVAASVSGPYSDEMDKIERSLLARHPAWQWLIRESRKEGAGVTVMGNCLLTTSTLMCK